MKKDANILIEGELTERVNGSADYTFSSGRSTTVTGDDETTISGQFKVGASSGEMRMSGSMAVIPPSIKLGSTGASRPVVLATPQVIAFFLAHTHTVVGSTTLQPTTPVTLPQLAARKVYGE